MYFTVALEQLFFNANIKNIRDVHVRPLIKERDSQKSALSSMIPTI